MRGLRSSSRAGFRGRPNDGWLAGLTPRRGPDGSSRGVKYLRIVNGGASLERPGCLLKSTPPVEVSQMRGGAAGAVDVDGAGTRQVIAGALDRPAESRSRNRHVVRRTERGRSRGSLGSDPMPTLGIELDATLGAERIDASMQTASTSFSPRLIRPRLSAVPFLVEIGEERVGVGQILQAVRVVIADDQFVQTAPAGVLGQ